MTDIVERLRVHCNDCRECDEERQEAADEIERLRVLLLQANDGSELLVAKAENAKLREALSEIASFQGRDQQDQAEIARAARKDEGE